RAIEAGGKCQRDFAVLYRSNLQSATIESALKERRIPTRVVGGTSLYERKEVKDVIAYLRVALDPRDEMSLRRILNYPARGIADVGGARLGSHATAHEVALWDAVVRAHAVHELPAAATEGCRQLVRIVEAARGRFDRGEAPTAIARAMIEDACLKNDIQL